MRAHPIEHPSCDNSSGKPDLSLSTMLCSITRDDILTIRRPGQRTHCVPLLGETIEYAARICVPDIYIAAVDTGHFAIIRRPGKPTSVKAACDYPVQKFIFASEYP